MAIHLNEFFRHLSADLRTGFIQQEVNNIQINQFINELGKTFIGLTIPCKQDHLFIEAQEMPKVIDIKSHPELYNRWKSILDIILFKIKEKGFDDPTLNAAYQLEAPVESPSAGPCGPNPKEAFLLQSKTYNWAKELFSQKQLNAMFRVAEFQGKFALFIQEAHHIKELRINFKDVLTKKGFKKEISIYIENCLELTPSKHVKTLDPLRIMYPTALVKLLKDYFIGMQKQPTTVKNIRIVEDLIRDMVTSKATFAPVFKTEERSVHFSPLFAFLLMVLHTPNSELPSSAFCTLGGLINFVLNSEKSKFSPSKLLKALTNFESELSEEQALSHLREVYKVFDYLGDIFATEKSPHDKVQMILDNPISSTTYFVWFFWMLLQYSVKINNSLPFSDKIASIKLNKDGVVDANEILELDRALYDLRNETYADVIVSWRKSGSDVETVFYTGYMHTDPMIESARRKLMEKEERKGA